MSDVEFFIGILPVIVFIIYAGLISRHPMDRWPLVAREGSVLFKLVVTLNMLVRLALVLAGFAVMMYVIASPRVDLRVLSLFGGE